MRSDSLRLLLFLTLLSSGLVLAQIHRVEIPHTAPHKAMPEIRTSETEMPHSASTSQGHVNGFVRMPNGRLIKPKYSDNHVAEARTPETHEPETHPHAHASHEADEQNTGFDARQLPFTIVFIGVVAFVIYLAKKQERTESQ